MRKLVSIVIVILITCFIPCSTLVRSEPISGETAGAAAQSRDTKDLFCNYAFSSFSLYSSFLSDYRQIGDYMVPVHGSTRTQARAYLTGGFTTDMAEAIIDECTIWNDSLRTLVIVPGDGIPVLTADDSDEIKVSSKDKNRIVLVREYNNCYREGDQYFFLVTMTSDGDTWKISELSFNAAKN